MTVRKRFNKRGFSLGEILVAIAIMAVIAAIVIPSVGSQLRSGDESRVQQDLNNIRSSAEQFLADVRRYPLTVSQLIRRPTTAAGDTSLTGGVYTTSQVNRWRGPYLAKDSVTTLATGFDETINNLFTSQTLGGQKYLTLMIPTFDSTAARNIDMRIDDGNKATGSIQWADSLVTTLKFFAIPIQ
jgi:prepilin-type N-terminal cleavage/methylation domain-containing protein